MVDGMAGMMYDSKLGEAHYLALWYRDHLETAGWLRQHLVGLHNFLVRLKL